MSYYVIFTLHGNIIEEAGKDVPFRDTFIDNVIRKNNSKGEDMEVQGNKVSYRIIRDKVFLTVGESNINEIVNKHSQNNKKEEKREIKKNEVKGKKRKWTGTAKELDFSNTNVTDQLIFETSSKYSLLNLKKKIIKVFDKKKLSEILLNKNVSSDIVNEILENVENIEEVKDKLRSIIKTRKIKKKDKILKIALVGLNGVGKSTTLSKLCYKYCTEGYSVYVAACDTFRAGAIEQLKVYVKRLQSNGYKIDMHYEGYKKEESKVAVNAINKIKDKNYDLLLVDTAGRTTEKRLMDSLKKLVSIGFDEVIYVNEALKGTTHDIMKFKEIITGIIVTKLDTVDDKIGAIVNFCYYSGKPLFYLAQGQSNLDMIEVDVEFIIDTLLSEK